MPEKSSNDAINKKPYFIAFLILVFSTIITLAITLVSAFSEMNELSQTLGKDKQKLQDDVVKLKDLNLRFTIVKELENLYSAPPLVLFGVRDSREDFVPYVPVFFKKVLANTGTYSIHIPPMILSQPPLTTTMT